MCILANRVPKKKKDQVILNINFASFFALDEKCINNLFKIDIRIVMSEIWR